MYTALIIHTSKVYNLSRTSLDVKTFASSSFRSSFFLFFFAFHDYVSQGTLQQSKLYARRSQDSSGLHFNSARSGASLWLFISDRIRNLDFSKVLQRIHFMFRRKLTVLEESWRNENRCYGRVWNDKWGEEHRSEFLDI